ncbi:hypothetical protein DL764_001509 [Monosporascus ibericus]|uniref:Uncharacterized protein n=1 Tax=Monosporascus ibericus TaxID=155417 RepID=A0A4Q4TU31_9PEZI|nr:hypothetical protein DL764_001509 [Monosporascus ibericus]
MPRSGRITSVTWSLRTKLPNSNDDGQHACEMEELLEEIPLPEYTDAGRIEHSKLAISNHMGMGEHSAAPQHGPLIAAADFYHIEGFEKLADASKVDYLNRLQPVTRRPAFSDLLYKPGSSSYRPKEVKGSPHFEYCLLSGPLGPIESDGSEDDEEWDLFEEFMPMDFGDVGDLKEPTTG